jgi:hypothetical protein
MRRFSTGAYLPSKQKCLLDWKEMVERDVFRPNIQLMANVFKKARCSQRPPENPVYGLFNIHLQVQKRLVEQKHFVELETVKEDSPGNTYS